MYHFQSRPVSHVVGKLSKAGMEGYRNPLLDDKLLCVKGILLVLQS